MPAGAVLTGIGTLLDVVLSGIGLWRQDEENRSARGLSLQLRAEDIVREERRRREDISRAEKHRKEEMSMLKKAEDYKKAIEERRWKWETEEKGYQRSQNFVTNFVSLLDREPAFRNQLLQVWR